MVTLEDVNTKVNWSRDQDHIDRTAMHRTLFVLTLSSLTIVRYQVNKDDNNNMKIIKLKQEKTQEGNQNSLRDKRTKWPCRVRIGVL